MRGGPVHAVDERETDRNVVEHADWSGRRPARAAAAAARRETHRRGEPAQHDRAFPPQLQLSPSAADGLASCSETAVGFANAVNPHTGTLEFAPEEASEESAAEEEAREAEGTLCPKASKIGTVSIRTPVLEQELHGSVYLAAENANPFPNNLFAIYVVVKDPKSGVVAKLAGKVEANPSTGQLTSTFANAPQLPFEDFRLEMKNGPRAPLATPRACGTYATAASFEPWSGGGAVGSFGPPEELRFAITSALTAPAAPARSRSRRSSRPAWRTRREGRSRRSRSARPRRRRTGGPGPDREAPAGDGRDALERRRCPEPQASAGTCAGSSLIGTATALAGLGSDPFPGTGRVYITGPYQGSAAVRPSIVLPTKAGPVRLRQRRDPLGDLRRPDDGGDNDHEQAPDDDRKPPLPPKGGVGGPVQLRRVDVTVQRPGGAPFQFNPTNCSPMAVTGTAEAMKAPGARSLSTSRSTGCTASVPRR